MKTLAKNKIIFILIAGIFPVISLGQNVEITEILYDAPGSDSGREWVEILVNEGGFDFTTWRFLEAEVKHKINFISGKQNVSVGDCLVLADNSTKFKTDFPNFSGNLFDSSFSLKNKDGEELKILKPTADDYQTVDSILYVPGEIGNEEWSSLQKDGDDFVLAEPTPGDCGKTVSHTTEDENKSNNNKQIANQNSGIDFQAIIPKIFLDISGGSEIISAGAETYFQAKVYGQSGDRINNSRITWTFGDGYRSEGNSVSHTWNYPGEYFLIVNASSGESNDTFRKEIVVKEAKIDLEFFLAEGGLKSRVVVKNLNDFNLDISRWFLKSDLGTFVLPKDTIILKNKEIIVDSELAGFEIFPAITNLYYPNGKLVKLKSKTNLNIGSKSQPIMKTGNEPSFSALKSQNVNLNSKISEKDNGKEFSTSSLVASPVENFSGSTWPYFLGVFGLIGAGIFSIYKTKDLESESCGDEKESSFSKTAEEQGEIKKEAKKYKIVYDDEDERE